jgi:hypothetical protein
MKIIFNDKEFRFPPLLNNICVRISLLSTGAILLSAILGRLMVWLLSLFIPWAQIILLGAAATVIVNLVVFGSGIIVYINSWVKEEKIKNYCCCLRNDS